MNGSNGINGDRCKWCGRAARLESNEYCSPDCYYAAHDEHQLHQVFCNDRQSLQGALRGINATIAELSEALPKDGLAHTELRQTVESMKRDASQIAERIQHLSQQIADLESRF